MDEQDLMDRVIFWLALGGLVWVCWQGWSGGFA
jgi:hypothetical protein